MNPADDHQFHDLGWLAAPAWLAFSAMEIVGVVINEQNALPSSYLHHLIEVSPALLAAGIGVLHWWSTNKYREAKLENDLAIAMLQAQTQRHTDPSSGDEGSAHKPKGMDICSQNISSSQPPANPANVKKLRKLLKQPFQR